MAKHDAVVTVTMVTVYVAIYWKKSKVNLALMGLTVRKYTVLTVRVHIVGKV